MDFAQKTSVLKRISDYTGLNFRQVLDLPYSYFLLLNRDSWLYSYQGSEKGMEILKNLWRVQQTQSDDAAVSEFRERMVHR